ncbi:hypothetical protein [Bacteroides sp.]
MDTVLGIIIAIIIITALALLIGVAIKVNKSRTEVNPVSPEELESAKSKQASPKEDNKT